MKEYIKGFNSFIQRVNEDEDSRKSYKRELELRDKLDNIFFRGDTQNIFSEEGEFGYLSSEHRLGKKISPRQRVERIEQVIADLKEYIRDLEWAAAAEGAYIKNPEYEKVWGKIEK